MSVIREGFQLVRVISDPKQFIGSGARVPAQGRHHVITRAPTEPHANSYPAGGARLTNPTLSLGAQGRRLERGGPPAVPGELKNGCSFTEKGLTGSISHL